MNDEQDEEINTARRYLKHELNRLESQELDAKAKLKKVETELKRIREQIADFKEMLGIK